ncbi:MAG TPA: TlpA disulfide reductase family protein [Chitinophagaceae bacterium]|nr:TlpA disulfide reductase family protein [Chitinophagaceae bacterium]
MNRKLLIGIAGTLLLGACHHRPTNGYSITGNLTGFRGKLLVLAYQKPDGFPSLDTFPVNNGHFTLSDTVGSPIFAQIATLDKSVGLPLFLERGDIRITGNLDSLDAIATGTPNNDALQELLTQEKPVMMQMKAFQSVYSEAQAQNDTVKEADLQLQYEGLSNQLDTLMTTFISTHPKVILSAMLLKDMASSIDPEVLAQDYAALDSGVKQSDEGKSLGAEVAVLNKVTTGEVAPDFTQSDVHGNPVNLSQFRGKYVLLDFWASWCGPCRKENPNVVKAFQAYKNKNFTIVGVSLDEDRNAWIKAIQEDHLDWNQVSDLKYWDNAAAKLYGVQAIPANFLLDTSGRIIARNLRGDDLDKKLAEVLK